MTAETTMAAAANTAVTEANVSGEHARVSRVESRPRAGTRRTAKESAFTRKRIPEDRFITHPKNETFEPDRIGRHSGGRHHGGPRFSAHPTVAVTARPGLSRRRAARPVLSAHANAQIAVLVHAKLHIGKFSGAGRVLNAHALAILPGLPAAAAAIKERQIDAALGRTCGRKQRHPSICHRLSLLRPANMPVNPLL